MLPAKVSQVLFSGLGGHASVVFSMVDGDKEQQWKHYLIFYGIESLNGEHVKKAAQRNLEYDMVIATEGKPLRAWRKFYNYLKQADPDIILLHSNSLTLPAWWYCRRHHKKLVVVEHTPNQVKRKVDKWISLLGQYIADKVVLLTEDYRKELKTIQKRHFKEKKVVVIPNGIDTSVFVQRKKKDFDDPVQLGMAARFSNTKDQILLVKVLQQLQRSVPGKFKLSLAGDGDELPAVKKLVQESGLSDHVHFTGSLDEKTLVGFFHQLDIYLHASKGETMSTSIMQAMACGLPIIASDIPGINNLVTPENGILTENTENAFAEAITRLSNDKELMITLGNNACKYVAIGFSNKKMFDSYNLLVEELYPR